MLAARFASPAWLGRTPRHECVRRAHCRILRATAAGHGYTERVLRYPDGGERRIRYPVPDRRPLQDLVIADADGGYRSFSETEQPDRWGPPEWDVTEMWDSNAHPQNVPSPAAASEALTGPPKQQKQQQQQQQQQQQADLLEDLFAQVEGSGYQDAQQRFWQRISDSYQVLEHCPWMQPRPLHVLAVAQLTAAAAAMYTLQTRLHHSAAEDELSKVLGRRRAGGKALVAVHRMAEGVVAFADEAAAERFGEELEAAGHGDVSLATVDSHQLFRLTGDSSAVVVAVADSADVSPGELEASLRARGEAFQSDITLDRPQ